MRFVKEPTYRVTDRIIDKATAEATNCLIHLAVAEAIPEAINISVSEGHVHYSIPRLRRRFTHPLQAWVVKIVALHDLWLTSKGRAGERCTPFTGRLPAPSFKPMRSPESGGSRTKKRRGHHAKPPVRFSPQRSYGHRRLIVAKTTEDN